MTTTQTWNDILDLEMRYRGNAEIACLIEILRDQSDLLRSIATAFDAIGDGWYESAPLRDDEDWQRLELLVGEIQ